MNRISSSLIFNDESCLSVLMVRGGNVLVFDNGVHCDAKSLLKSSAFFEDSKKRINITNFINIYTNIYNDIICDKND